MTDRFGPQRLIIVDDNDKSTNITYTGGWSLDNTGGEWNGVGDNGNPFRSTLHKTTTTSSVTFRFKGNAVWAYGSVRLKRDTTDRSGFSPSWTCEIDGRTEGTNAPTADVRNYQSLCTLANGLEWGDHELKINVDSRGDPFWIDTFEYRPSYNVSRSQRRSIISLDDEELAWSQGWGKVDRYRVTNANAASVRLPFEGVSLEWYGGYAVQMSRTPATGTYSIDGSTPVEFPLTGPPEGTRAFYRTKLFETPELSPGSHIIEVSYRGGSTSAPLTFWQAYVNHGTLQPGDIRSTNNGWGSSSTTLNIGAIVGGAIAGIFLLLIAALVFYIVRLRKRLQGSTPPGDVDSGLLSGPASITPAMASLTQSSDPQPFQYAPVQQQYGYTTAYQDEATALMQDHHQPPSHGSRSPPLPERPRMIPPTKHTRLAIPPVRQAGSVGSRGQSLHSDGATGTSSEYFNDPVEEPPLYSMGR